MSLLLDARKKSQQALSAQLGDPLTPESGPQGMENPGERMAQAGGEARNAGQNLFAAKSRFPVAALPDRKVLYALGGTILLVAAALGYLWYVNSASDTTPLRPAGAPAVSLARPIQPTTPAIPETAETQIAEDSAPDSAAEPEADRLAAIPEQHAPAAGPPPRAHPLAPPDNSPIRIEQKKIEAVDPLLSDAYLAYRSGTPDKARQLYLAMLEKDEQNPDALLGLATIAQQHGENRAAVQYFGRLLALDPRNAAANAGMASLNADDDYNESRLKILLREQGNSAVLHFALGNLYARQLRWGEAQQAYFNACLLEPGNAEFAFNLAVSLDHLGQKKLAAQYYRQAMQLDPSRSAGFDHAQISQRAQELTGIVRSLP